MIHLERFSRLGALVCALMLGMVACEPEKKGGASSTTPTSQTATRDTSSSTAGSASASSNGADATANPMLAETLALLEKGEGLREAHYEALMLDLASCEIDAKHGFLDSDCPSLQRLTQVRKKHNRHIKNMTAMWSRIGQKHLGHPSPSVRLYAVQKLGSLFTVNEAGQKILLGAAAKETSPAVLITMVRTSRNAMGKHESMSKFVLEHSRHDDVGVRREALLALVSPWAMGTEGTLERAMEMIRTDPEMEIRKLGCAGIGARADDRALPLLEEYTAWPAKEEELYDECYRGLVEMWAARVVHKRPSEAAYKLTLERLEQKSRTQKHPSWKIVSSLGIGGREQFLERAPWYEPKRMNALLSDLIGDANFNWLGRRSAIDALVLAGASSAQLEEVLDKHFSGGLIKKDSSEHHKFLSRHLEKKIQEAKAYEAQQKQLEKEEKKDAKP